MRLIEWDAVIDGNSALDACATSTETVPMSIAVIQNASCFRDETREQCSLPSSATVSRRCHVAIILRESFRMRVPCLQDAVCPAAGMAMRIFS